MSASGLLHLSRLHKAYGERVILDIRDLQLQAGNCYALTGVNGAGKSTLLRILAGLEPAQTGEAVFAGKPVRLHPYPEWLRQHIVYVHQHPYLFNTSVAENIAYGLHARGASRREVKSVVEEAMHWAGVAHLAHVPPHRLSGGEKQRIALARAKVLHPRLLLLDEPTANLDGEARTQTIELVRALTGEDNCVVVACHCQEMLSLPELRRLELEGGHLDRAAADDISAQRQDNQPPSMRLGLASGG